MVDEMEEVFSREGPLAQENSDYRYRPAQQQLAQAIQVAIDAYGTLVAEAGTGTGKTWAYLVPAFLSGAKVLVSTGTRPLQDQLFHRDIPRLRKALQVSVSAALLKGRSNYVCHYHLDKTLRQGLLASHEQVEQLREIEALAQHSQSGDKSELASVAEDAPIWSQVTSTRENCLGQDRPFVRECFVLNARRRAQEADVVVINHALYMADLNLREEGITDLLPEVDLVVFDEAHQLPEVATRFLGSSVSSYQLLDLALMVEQAGKTHAQAAGDWTPSVRALQEATRELRQVSQAVQTLPGRRVVFEDIPDAQTLDACIERLLVLLYELIEALGDVQESHPDLHAAFLTAQGLHQRLFMWTQPDRQGEFSPGMEDTTENRAAVRWLEATQHHIRLHRAPLSVAPQFQRARPEHQAWVFVSATLSVNGDFSHFQHQLGLEAAHCEVWESSFDYQQHALLYVPQNLPLPSHPNFTAALGKEVFTLIEASNGGTMVLCTSLRAVAQLGEQLRDAVKQGYLERSVLVQGDAARGRLLEQFREAGNAVLIGSASFWEGIDIPGRALSVLVIDKLPFAPPDDPVLQARIKACRAAGGNPFMEFQLPQAAIALKQGAGRLIRSEEDTGVLMVGDRRLVEKPYGRLLWRGLPPFQRSREASTVLAFMQARKC